MASLETTISFNMATDSKSCVLVVGHRGMLGRELMKGGSGLGPTEGVDREECDIRDPAQVARVIDYYRPRLLINAAAYTDVDGCEKNRELAWEVNARGAGNLARACRSAGMAMVQLSTDFVFDGRKGKPYSEDDPLRPLSVYGESKLGGERAVQRSAGRYLIIRTAWLFGEGGRNFPDTILKTARTSDSLSVVFDQKGCPTYVPDLCRAIVKLIELNAGGVFHVTNRGSCSWFEYAVFILKAAGLRTRVLPVTAAELARPAARPPFSVLSLRKYQATTGSRMRPWEEAVREYVGTRRARSEEG